MPDPRIAFFDQLAPTWDTDGPPHAEILARLQGMRDELGLSPGRSLLEVGCGTGAMTGWLAQAVTPASVTAVDFAPAMLRVARERGIDAEFRCLDVCADDLGTSCFDIALCLHSLPHFRDQRAAVRNLARSLRSGGRLIILHFDGWEAINVFHSRIGGVVAGDQLPPPAVLADMLRDAGLAVIALRDEPDLLSVIADKP